MCVHHFAHHTAHRTINHIHDSRREMWLLWWHVKERRAVTFGVCSHFTRRRPAFEDYAMLRQVWHAEINEASRVVTQWQRHSGAAAAAAAGATHTLYCYNNIFGESLFCCPSTGNLRHLNHAQLRMKYKLYSRLQRFASILAAAAKT